MKSDRPKSGMEQDVVHYRSMYCYLVNNPSCVKMAKKAMVRRMRRLAQVDIQQGLVDHEYRYAEDHEDII